MTRSKASEYRAYLYTAISLLRRYTHIQEKRMARLRKPTATLVGFPLRGEHRVKFRNQGRIYFTRIIEIVSVVLSPAHRITPRKYHGTFPAPAAPLRHRVAVGNGHVLHYRGRSLSELSIRPQLPLAQGRRRRSNRICGETMKPTTFFFYLTVTGRY